MTDREFLEAQAPLRAAWNDETLSDEEREQAGAELKALVEQFSAEHPPITGVFYYTEEDVEEAKRHGF
jgi:hypothetical protein